ncbi:metallophosphoesterase [Jeotgalibacillus aurantiacus]|uniref:metallophosphoesterase n=1 Tax=Jeotgalibacillus aurantiacus TaxID=2763266 RepID=UPI001D0BAF92|nr:metallophosphoesterase [Jeotgalibacillus aurantiacus]
MKILVVSDNHGDRTILQSVKDVWRNQVDWMFHAGDSELPFESEEMDGFEKVRGNCDFDVMYPEEHVVDTGHLKVFITHGHLFGIKSSLNRIRYRAEETEANIILFGHSHMLGAELVEGRLYLNPGSIRLPRDRNEPTYAVISIEGSEVEVDFYTDKHEKLLDWNGELRVN